MKPITEKQQKVLDLIRKSFKDRAVAPTERELADSLNVNHDVARGHILKLAEKGYIRKIPRVNRGIELLDDCCPCCGRKNDE